MCCVTFTYQHKDGVLWVKPTYWVITVNGNTMEQKRKSQKERCSISKVVLVHRCEYSILCLADRMQILFQTEHLSRDLDIS